MHLNWYVKMYILREKNAYKKFLKKFEKKTEGILLLDLVLNLQPFLSFLKIVFRKFCSLTDNVGNHGCVLYFVLTLYFVCTLYFVRLLYIIN